MSQRVTMLGSRDLSLPPADAVALYRQAAYVLATRGYRIVTLPSAGACQLAAETALVVRGSVELLIPGDNYESSWIKRVKAEHGDRVVRRPFDLDRHVAWAEADEVLHPEHRKLGTPDASFFACTYGAVAEGEGLIVVPWEGERGFEVAPAIRVARALTKPLLVLTDAGDRERLKEML